MLNKKVCIQCKVKKVNEYARIHDFEPKALEAMHEYSLDTRWWCPAIHDMLNDSDEAPINCPYRLEQVISDAGL